MGVRELPGRGFSSRRIQAEMPAFHRLLVRRRICRQLSPINDLGRAFYVVLGLECRTGKSSAFPGEIENPKQYRKPDYRLACTHAIRKAQNHADERDPSQRNHVDRGAESPDMPGTSYRTSRSDSMTKREIH